MIELLCKILADSGNTNEIIGQLKSFNDQDFRSFIALSNQHGVMPQVYRYVNNHGLTDQIPADIFRVFREHTLSNTTRNMLFLYEATGLFKSLTAAEIPVMGLKGIFLLDNVYKDISQRQMSDIDILVKRQDVMRALAIARELGYLPTTYFNSEDENIDIKHVPPLKKDDGPYLEIHWTILEENEPFTIDTRGLWERAIPVRISNVNVSGLSPEDLILHLCLHLAYQHHLSIGLRGLVDIIETRKKFVDILDWEKFLGISETWGANRVVLLTFKLIEDLFQIAAPEAFSVFLDNDSIPAEILESAKKFVLLQKKEDITISPDLAELSSNKGFFSRIKLISSRIFLPKRVIARIYNLEPNSFSVYYYYFVRFRDLFRYYWQSVWGIVKRDNQTLAGVENMKAQIQLKDWLSEE
jgi:hypothetical protein